MAYVQVDGRQWGVGHGGFHTETVSLRTESGEEQLRFIFDCGTTSGKDSLNKAIKSYIGELQASTAPGNNRSRLEIDALYISHFDLDHISGVEKLITDLNAARIKIKSVYAPFLSSFEKLCLVSSSLFATGNNISAPSMGIITDPVSWFSETAGFTDDSIHLLSDNPDAYDSQDSDLESEETDNIIPAKTVSSLGVGNVNAARLKLWLCVPFVRNSHFSTMNYQTAIKEIRALISSHESGSLTDGELHDLLDKKNIKPTVKPSGI